MNDLGILSQSQQLQNYYTNRNRALLSPEQTAVFRALFHKKMNAQCDEEACRNYESKKVEHMRGSWLELCQEINESLPMQEPVSTNKVAQFYNQDFNRCIHPIPNKESKQFIQSIIY